MKLTTRITIIFLAICHIMGSATFAVAQEIKTPEEMEIVKETPPSTQPAKKNDTTITIENHSLEDKDTTEEKTNLPSLEKKEDIPVLEKHDLKEPQNGDESEIPAKDAKEKTDTQSESDTQEEATAEEEKGIPTTQKDKTDTTQPEHSVDETTAENATPPEAEEPPIDETGAEQQQNNITTKHSMDLSLDIAEKMAPSYTVVIPDEIKFGELSTTKDSMGKFKIEVELQEDARGDIKVASLSHDGELVNSENSSSIIPFKNEFLETSFAGSKTITSNLRIKPQDVKNAELGDYSATMQFEFSFVPDEALQTNKCEFVTTEELSTKKANVSNGLNRLAENNEDDEKTYFIVEYLDKNSPSHKTGQEYLPNDYLDKSLAKNKSAVKAIDTKADKINPDTKNKTFYALNVVKKSGEKRNIVDETSNILEIRLPVEKENNEEVFVLRSHKGKVEQLSRLVERPAKDSYVEGSYFEGADCIYIYSSKFSIYTVCTIEKASQQEAPPVTPEPPEPTPEPTPNPIPEPLPPIQEEGNLKDGEYTADVSLRKESDFGELSMCDSLFARKADLDVDGDETKLTLYIIDPIPKYKEYGTPLSNVRFTFDGTTYKAKVDNDDKENRYYKKSSGFINTSGNYKSSKITVTIPTKAIESSVNKTLKCTAYVEAVMKTTQSFYVVLDDFEKGQTKEEGDSTVELDNEDYKADVSIRKYNDIDSKSMCDPLFYDKADAEVNGKDTKLTLYVIDPIPSYPDEGTPLSRIRFEYDSETYSAKVIPDDSLIRYYGSASGFIEQSGDYKSSKITVTVPTEAVEQSPDKGIKCTAFVNAVMKTEQSFYVVLSDFETGKTKNTANTAKELEPVSPQLTPNAATHKNTGETNTSQKQNIGIEVNNSEQEKTTSPVEPEVQASIGHPKSPIKIKGDSLVLKIILGTTIFACVAFIGYSGYLYFRRKK